MSPVSEESGSAKKLLQGCRLLPCTTSSGRLGRIMPVPLPAPGPSTSPYFKSEQDTQDTLWSNQDRVNPESDLTSRYLLLRRWVLLGRSPKAHWIRQVARGENDRTAELRHGIILRITNKVSLFHSCQWSPSPRFLSKKGKRNFLSTLLSSQSFDPNTHR